MQNLNMAHLNDTSRIQGNDDDQKQFQEPEQSEVDKNTDLVKSEDSLMFKLK